ncbi:uncharacterized protein LOC141907780 [Tubulanus polymorphus]|uniref:uncharacterized protein LOC141907780 n=1 Tax=Tubulanus polymorphus TaxID=672921 RepID=UPI003DA3FC30
MYRYRSRIEPEQWRFIDGKSNPADDASRGQKVDAFMKNEVWKHGPEFLRKPDAEWPRSSQVHPVPDDDVEVKKTTLVLKNGRVKNSGLQPDVEDDCFHAAFKRCSSWYRLTKCVTWMLRYVNKLQSSEPISVLEMRSAEKSILKIIQKWHFPDEVERLPDVVSFSSEGGKRDVKKSSRIRKLNPMMVDAVRHVLGRCVDCKKNHGKPESQMMADLPVDRTNLSEPPFTNVGVDLFGPYNAKRGRVIVKRYGCVFTCLNIRAVHIEVTDDLSTPSFINAQRRFIARRGQPEIIRSDNGTNFTGGERELRDAVESWNQAKIHECLMQKGTQWIFNPPSASHWGGVWARCIRSIRKILNVTLRQQILNDEGLRTFICEAEAIMNSRPLTPVSDDPNDLHALTPNHLLLLRSGPGLPPGKFEKTDQYCRRSWRHVQYLADQFWIRYAREYLPMLQERQKWCKKRRNIKIGDLVLVVDDRVHRSEWPLGRIIAILPGTDDIVRRVTIKTAKSTIDRPINKCVLLECDST